MNKSNSGWLAALLVFAALLVGGVALSTVGGEAEKPKAETKPAAEKSAPEAVAAAQEAPAAQSPATGAEASERRLEEILRVLASAGTVPSDLRDPAFDYYVDLALLGNAWADLDAALLTDLALQVVEGERVLLRPHRVVRSSDLLEIAIRLAAAKNDEATLARLEKAVQRSQNLDLAAQLAEARKLAANAATTDAVWTVPVETTSAQVFASYKGFLQDIVAALVVRDWATLTNLEQELGSAADLPEAHRAKLVGKVKAALTALAAGDEKASPAADVLHKLAHSTRNPWANMRRPLASGRFMPGGGGEVVRSHTSGSDQPTQCPAISVATQCPVTQCPQPTQCPEVVSQCPAGQTTQCSSGQPTQCQPVLTQCPEGATPTQCPAVLSQCPAGQTTQCTAGQPTQCPESCPQPTQQPSQPTQCQAVSTSCPEGSVATQCPAILTQCPQTQTYCWGCSQPTQQPAQPSQCQAVPTSCPSKGCNYPSMYPQVPTQCPAMRTMCPPAMTYCPANCAPPQQQQKQKWIPSKGKYYPGDSSQQSDYPTTPYSRRDNYGQNW